MTRQLRSYVSDAPIRLIINSLAVFFGPHSYSDGKIIDAPPYSDAQRQSCAISIGGLAFHSSSSGISGCPLSRWIQMACQTRQRTCASLSVCCGLLQHRLKGIKTVSDRDIIARSK
ncbi:hypothetical protein GWI33_014260 [Rhynchophorus ferrugineus]|uniref:Uncharacterized protein n=1 Tax=Rhynchophorus ferrugineus TaxID=354439 RepID=A0A834I7R3_RHYFE|nr:hypothetical protein GWI33_014260 [Rhynchophorus ferrugineus]